MFAQVTLELLNGFGMTCKLFGLTLLMALPLGLVISLGVMSPFKPLAGFLKVVIWVVRGTPLLLQLLVIYYGPGIIGQNIWGTGDGGRFIAA
ncbi:MAG: ABC transporter permease subunit, partial [Eubacterium sp.]|nr:ABC transporter permease subunit [Eubacterium sp.]